MSLRLIDTHCHIHFPAYDADRAEVLARLEGLGGGAITVGTSLANSRAAIALAEQHPNIWASVGLHPSHVTHPFHDENEGVVEERDVSHEALKTLAKSSSRVVAIGEAGLDIYRVEPDQREEALKKQMPVFETHLNVAEELSLPVIVHCREALHELNVFLRERRAQGHLDRCVLHSFTGTWAEAKPLLEIGCYIGLNGIVTFPPRKNTQPEDWLEIVAKNVPKEQLLIETDAPYLAPTPHRGERNEPAYVQNVAEYLASVRGVTREEILAQTTENVIKVFGV
ncbi:TatD family hydrolase [Patescibacteria group bacterium]|nr:TatD family hydrolase [Patescibacteria group bacterium]